MIEMQPLYWLGLLAVLLVIEAVTTGLTTIWFAGGALIAAIACNLGAGFGLQLVLFIGISLVLLIFTRPLAVKYMSKDLEQTNVNGLIGKKARVTREISNLAGTGQIKLNDIDWMARTSEDNAVIPENAIVEIVAVNGVKLIVREYREE